MAETRSSSRAVDLEKGHDVIAYEKRLPQIVPTIAFPLEKIRSHEKRRPLSLVDEEKKLVFTRHAEATWSELYFDIFFVANLTTFTGALEIDDVDALQAYIGFFAILWFTWLQASLFDLRFGKDSFLQRICKGLQVGVQVGFSAINSNFHPAHPEKYYVAFKTLSLLLMTSRIVLVVQYFSVWAETKKYKKTASPLLFTTTVYILSSITFLVVFFLIKPVERNKVYVFWYIILFIETTAVLLISMRWRIVSFKTTHLIQRMGLLTLIVIGEGIIGLCETVNAIIRGYGWTDTSTGHAIAATTAIYLLYCIYFDDEPKYEYSTVNQQLWAVLHFPLHLAIVLYVEGQKSLILWYNMLEALNAFKKLLNAKLENVAITAGAEAAQVLKDAMEIYFPSNEDEGSSAVFEQQPSFLFNLNGMATSSDPDYIEDQIRQLTELTTVAIFSGYGVEPPESYKTLGSGNRQYFEAFVEVYELVFVYYYLAAAGMLFVLAIFTYLIQRRKDKFDWLHILYRIILGVTLAFICCVCATPAEFHEFITGPYPVPVMVILMFLFFIVDRLTIWLSVRLHHTKISGDAWPGAKHVAINAHAHRTLGHNYFRRPNFAKALHPKMPAPVDDIYIHPNRHHQFFEDRLSSRNVSPRDSDIFVDAENDQVPFIDAGAQRPQSANRPQTANRPQSADRPQMANGLRNVDEPQTMDRPRTADRLPPNPGRPQLIIIPKTNTITHGIASSPSAVSPQSEIGPRTVEMPQIAPEVPTESAEVRGELGEPSSHVLEEGESSTGAVSAQVKEKIIPQILLNEKEISEYSSFHSGDEEFV